MDQVLGPEVRVGLTLPSPARGGGRMDTCTKPRSVRRRGRAQMPLGAGQPVGPSPQQGSSLPALRRCHREPAVFTLTIPSPSRSSPRALTPTFGSTGDPEGRKWPSCPSGVPGLTGQLHGQRAWPGHILGGHRARQDGQLPRTKSPGWG